MSQFAAFRLARNAKTVNSVISCETLLGGTTARDWARWLHAMTPLSPLRKPGLAADIRGWYAESLNARLGRADLQVIAPELIYRDAGTRLFEAPDGRVLLLSTESEPINGWMIADWLAHDGITHHAFVLRTGEHGKLMRFHARGERAERTYLTTPVADGWYTFGVDQNARLLACGAPASAAGKTSEPHRQLLGNMPGLFFGELYIVAGRVLAFNNRSYNYRTTAALHEQAQALVPQLAAAQFLARW